jgi:hypothetical protein
MTEPTKKDLSVPEPASTPVTGLLSAKELEDFEKVLLSGPLEETTRKERRFLLGVSLIAFTSVKAGLMPTEISALGIKCSQMNADWFLFILGLVVLYFWIAFLVYGICDGILWWRIERFYKHNKKSRAVQMREDTENEVEQGLDKAHPVAWIEGGKAILERQNPELVNKVRERATTAVNSKYLPFLTRYDHVGLSLMAYVRLSFDVLVPFGFGLYVIALVFMKLPTSFLRTIFWFC